MEFFNAYGNRVLIKLDQDDLTRRAKDAKLELAPSTNTRPALTGVVESQGDKVEGDLVGLRVIYEEFRGIKVEELKTENDEFIVVAADNIVGWFSE